MLLITQSLLASWQYAMDSGDDERFEDFRRTLRREPGEKTEAMQKGIDFERCVYEACRGLTRDPHPEWQPGIEKVAAIIKGGQFQVPGEREIDVLGERFLLYGIADCIKCGTIYDVKFSSRSFGSAELAGKYFDSPQHPAYLALWPEAAKFIYVVSDGEDIYTEEYTRMTGRNIKEIIEEFYRSMKALGLAEEYRKHWEARE